MLKGPLYAEYQQKYDAYMGNIEKVRTLQRRIEDLQQEQRNYKAQLVERKNSLNADRSADLSVRKERKRADIRNLEKERKSIQKHLDELMAREDGGKGDLSYDENQRRKELDAEKTLALKTLEAQYDAEIQHIRASMEGLNEEFEDALKNDLGLVEGSTYLLETYEALQKKAAANELPKSITDALAMPTEQLISFCQLTKAAHVASAGKKATQLDDLNSFTPKWLERLVYIGLPILLGAALLLFFIITGVHFRFVGTAMSAIVSFLLWTLCGAVAGGILFGIVMLTLGSTVLGVIVAVIGVIGGFWFATRWYIHLPYGFVNVVEWIFKVLVSLLLWGAIAFLNNETSLGDKLIALGMKIGPVKRAAIERQGKQIEQNSICYAVLLRYKEVIERLNVDAKQARFNELTHDLEQKEKDKLDGLQKKAKEIDLHNDTVLFTEQNAAAQRREEYDAKQQELSRQIEEAVMKLGEYDGEDGKIKRVEKRFQADCAAAEERFAREIAETDEALKHLEDSKYAKEIRKSQQKIQTIQDAFQSDLKELNELFIEINSNLVNLNESQGVLSDSIFIFDPQSQEKPVKLHEIRHDKKPIVFLYDNVDSTNVAASLYTFMNAVLQGFAIMNARETLELVVVDPVTKAIDFEASAAKHRLSIENDVSRLTQSIQEMIQTAAKNGTSIDEHNRKMYEDKEDKVRYFKYKVVEFLVPEEAAAQNTNFFKTDLWGLMANGSRFGFLPIFFINYSDWKNTLDDNNRMNSQFIKLLIHSIGSSNGTIYRIDPNLITVKEYRD